MKNKNMAKEDPELLEVQRRLEEEFRKMRTRRKVLRPRDGTLINQARRNVDERKEPPPPVSVDPPEAGSYWVSNTMGCIVRVREDLKDE